jgi:hypothetical protein
VAEEALRRAFARLDAGRGAVRGPVLGTFEALKEATDAGLADAPAPPAPDGTPVAATDT